MDLFENLQLFETESIMKEQDEYDDYEDEDDDYDNGYDFEDEDEDDEYADYPLEIGDEIYVIDPKNKTGMCYEIGELKNTSTKNINDIKYYSTLGTFICTHDDIASFRKNNKIYFSEEYAGHDRGVPLSYLDFCDYED